MTRTATRRPLREQGPVDHDRQPRHTAEVTVEGDAVLQLGAEADQGAWGPAMLPRCVTVGGSLRTGGDAGVVKGQACTRTT
jgi:hypothetical protein